MKEIINYGKRLAIDIFTSFAESPVLGKCVKALIFIWVLFAGIHIYLYSIITLTILDVVTGIIASVKKGEPFKSKILRKGLIEKVILYNILIVSVFALEYVIKSALGYDTYWLVMLATMLIGTYELSSIMENLLVISPNLVFIKSLIRLTDKLRDKTVSIAENKIEKLDENNPKKTD